MTGKTFALKFYTELQFEMNDMFLLLIRIQTLNLNANKCLFLFACLFLLMQFAHRLD